MWLFSTDGTLVPLILRLALAIVIFPHGAQKVLGWFGAFVGYAALCGGYVMLYPAISELSPSLEFLRALRRTPGATMAIASIDIPAVAGADAIMRRVDNLQSSGLVTSQGGLLRLTSKGREIARPLD